MTGHWELDFDFAAWLLLRNIQNFRLNGKPFKITSVFPLFGKLPKQGLDILFKAKDSLDENNPVSTEKLPLRRTRVKSDLKELTNQLMKACEPTPEYSSVKK